MINQTLHDRYRVTQKIGEGSTSIVYKGTDTKENRTVALKIPRESIRTKDISSIMRFSQQMRSFVSLDSPHIVNIYDVFQHQNFPVVVTEYVEGWSLSEFINSQNDIDVDKMVSLMIDILKGLEFIHSKGIIHRDIKPSNIMLEKDTLETKITDFGLALLLDLSQIEQQKEIAGTFSYMSPEQTGMLKKPLDFRSDIYAAGILFYKLLTKKLPFTADDIPTLIHKHIAQIPEFPSKLNSQIIPVVDRIILKMLAKDPQDRYQTEKGITCDLEEYLSERKQGKTAIDFEIARGDKLTQLTYQSRLIGRKKELELLQSLIDGLKENRGNIVLIAGKAGSGKTRLVNELRSYAYSQNAFFVSGKCYKAAYKTPYAVFKEALEDYIERIKRLPSNLREEQIGLMKEALGQLGKEVAKITPKIEDLLGEQPALVELEPQKEKIRFLLTVSNFLISITTFKYPLILFLDDMQWADESTLEVLREVGSKIYQSSLLIISTYRGEEVEPDHSLTQIMISLQDQQIESHFINIKDLSEEETNLVISEILSEDPAVLKPLSSKIFSQTGGNPFFLTEIIHTLINSGAIFFKEGHYSYDLSKIESLTLSDNVIDMLISRIKTLTPQTSQVLSYGAVIGKKFLVGDVLRLLSFMDPQQILSSIEEAIENQFLTRHIVPQEEIVFVHDRVREAFYEKLPQQERTELNKEIAFSLEEQYKLNPDPVVFDLAYHFIQAGIEDKSLVYSLKAAHKAKISYAHAQAIELYNTAKEILQKQNKIDTSEYIDVLENLGEMYRLVGRFDESMEVLKICEPLIPETDKLHKAQVLSKMGDTLWEKGQVENSVQVLEQALAILGVKVPKKVLGVIFGILKEFFVQMLHMWFPRIFVRQKYREDQIGLTIANLYDRMGHIWYFTDIKKSFYCLLKCLNLLEKIGPCSKLAYWYILGAAVWSSIPWFSRAFRDGNKGLEMAIKLQDRIREGSAYTYLGWGLFLANRQRKALEYAQKGINLLKNLGEYWDLGGSFATRTYSVYYSGRLKEGLQNAEEFVSVARSVKALQNLGWALGHKGIFLSSIGEDISGAIEELKESIKLEVQTKDEASLVEEIAYLAFAYLRKKDYEAAIKNIEEAAKLFSMHYGAWIVDHFPIGAQIYLDIIIASPDLPRGRKEEYIKRAGWFCKQCFSWGRKFKFILGWAYQVNGTYQWLIGKKKKAIKIWGKGIKFLREQTEDKYRLGLILLEEGKLLFDEKEPELKERARGYLEEARELFLECGAKLDFKNTNSILGITEGVEEPSAKVYEETTSTTTLAEKERALSLAEATRLISSILDLDQLLGKIVELSIKASGAERGFLLLYNQDTKRLELALSFPQEEQTREINFSKIKISKTIVSFVEQKKQGIIYPPIESQKETIEKSESISIYGIRSILCSPLLTKDKLIGMLYLDNRLAEGVFEQKDLDTLNSICSQAAISIENARLYIESQEKARLEHEINTARQIQRSLLPSFSPQVGDLKVEGAMLSATEVAGDYYDFIPYGSEKLGIVVADVSGKGMDAGMVMSMAKSSIHMLAEQRISPREVILKMNKHLYSQLNQQKFISLIYAEYTDSDHTFTWGGGGHEHVIVRRTSTGKVEAIKTGGIILGMFEDIEDKIPQKSVVLDKGDRIILYSDGATEAKNSKEEMFSLKRLVEVIRQVPECSVKELLEYLTKQIQEFIQDAPQYDDITLVVMGRE